jgi:phosphate transport system protein
MESPVLHINGSIDVKRHIDKEIESLKTNLIKMGSIAEEAVRQAIKSFIENDPKLAQQVLMNEERINSLEIEIDNTIVDILALQQPVAIDLRLLLAAQKINNDLERIGDHAVNIAESELTIAKHANNELMKSIPPMCELAQTMLRDALDSFIHTDATLGTSVLQSDDTIDNANRHLVKSVMEQMKQNPSMIEPGMELIRISRNIERIADLATNIAEEVIFIADARFVKHSTGVSPTQ